MKTIAKLAAVLCALAMPAAAQNRATAAQPVYPVVTSRQIGPAPVVSTVIEAAHVLSAVPTNFYGVDGSVFAANGYLMVLNLAAVPASAATVAPLVCLQLTAAGPFAYRVPWPVTGTTGIVVAYSSTGCFTYTPLAQAFFSGWVYH